MKNIILLAIFIAAHHLYAQTFNKTVYNSVNSGLPHNSIQSISIDNNDVIWVGTQQGGLARFDGTNWSVWNMSNSNLPGNFIIFAKVLANGEVWLSIINSGTSHLYWVSKLAGNTITNFSDVIDGYDIVDAFTFRNNKVWVSSNEGLYVYQNNTFLPFNTAGQCIPEAAVSDILFVTLDKYWIALSDYFFDGLHAHGLLQIEQNNCTHYDSNNSDFPTNNYVGELVLDKNNPDKVWMNTNSGVVSFDGTDWEVFRPSTSGPRCFVIDSSGAIWASFWWDGFQKYDGVWHSYQSVVNDQINALAIDSHDNIWVGTLTSGLIKLERTDSITATPDVSSVSPIKCYPTIFGQELYIEQEQDRTSSLVLTDINSRVVVQEKCTGRKTTISMSGRNLPPGAYFYCIKNENNDILQTGKLLKTE